MTTAPAIGEQPKGEAWHSQSAEEVLAQLGSASTGLSAQEAAQRLATNGPNELKEGKRISPLQIFLGHPAGWRHGRECARDNFHHALPVLRGRGVEMETGAKGGEWRGGIGSHTWTDFGGTGLMSAARKLGVLR